MIFITGDTHRTSSMDKIKAYNFIEGQNLTKKDYLIVLGDFGFIWNNDEEEMFWRNWFKRQPFTTLFIDGNHENFDLLKKFPTTTWNGGKVSFINDSIIHLKRGQVFTIDGYTFFTFGGAMSIDKHRRTEGVSWWKQEIPSIKEYKEGLKNLDKHNFTVDYVLTHTCPTCISTLLGFTKFKDPAQGILDQFLDMITFKKWLFGHFHIDKIMNHGDFIAVYDQVIKLIQENT